MSTFSDTDHSLDLNLYVYVIKIFKNIYEGNEI